MRNTKSRTVVPLRKLGIAVEYAWGFHASLVFKLQDAYGIVFLFSSYSHSIPLVYVYMYVSDTCFFITHIYSFGDITVIIFIWRPKSSTNLPQPLHPGTLDSQGVWVLWGPQLRPSSFSLCSDFLFQSNLRTTEALHDALHSLQALSLSIFPGYHLWVLNSAVMLSSKGGVNWAVGGAGYCRMERPFAKLPRAVMLPESSRPTQLFCPSTLLPSLTSPNHRILNPIK